MTSAVVEPKSVQKRKKGQTEATNEPAGDSASLVERLAAFCFVAPVQTVEGFNLGQRGAIREALDAWELDRITISKGGSVRFKERHAVPAFLRSFESVSDEQAKAATEAGEAAAGTPDIGSDQCPYVIDSALWKAWNAALVAGVENAAEPSPAAKPLTEAPADAKLREAALQREAIERLQAEMEEAANEAADLEDEADSLKSELKEVKAAFDDASKRSRKLSRKLRDARRGFFDRPAAQKTLPGLEAPYAGDSHDVDAPAKPAVDEGAFVSLEYLTRGQLQEFIPGTPEDRGLSEKQVEKLKELVGGETIGHLEKWQKSKGDYWAKELKDAAIGFGKEAVTKLQDAVEVIRRKFPIPDPDGATPAPAGDHRKTVEDLQILINDCEEYQDEPDADDGGVEYCKSVASQAASMKQSILASNAVTGPQMEAVKNWQVGVGKWFDGLAHYESADE